MLAPPPYTHFEKNNGGNHWLFFNGVDKKGPLSLKASWSASLEGNIIFHLTLGPLLCQDRKKT